MRDRAGARPLLAVNAAVLLFGLAGLFARWIALPAVVITFGRVVCSCAALLAVLLATRTPLRLRARRDAGLLALAGVVLAAHWWAFLQTVQLSSVAIGTITFSAFPLFVTLLEPAVTRRPPGAKDLAAAGVILLGVAVTVRDWSPGSQTLAGVALGLLAALLYAVLTLLNQRLVRRYSATLVACYEQAAATVALLPLALTAGAVPTARDLGLLVLLGVGATAVAHTLFLSSLTRLPARLAGICSSLETVYGILFAFLLLGEAPTLQECLGAAIIFAVVLWSQLRKPE